jgi:hypothetical protein
VGASELCSGHPKLPVQRLGFFACDHLAMTNETFDALNALKVCAERQGQPWVTLDEIADELHQGSSETERQFDGYAESGLAERQKRDSADPEYKISRDGERLVADES